VHGQAMCITRLGSVTVGQAYKAHRHPRQWASKLRTRTEGDEEARRRKGTRSPTQQVVVIAGGATKRGVRRGSSSQELTLAESESFGRLLTERASRRAVRTARP
jgi:hypothetical protein